MMTELAQRAVACRHWRWMPGMRAIVPKNLPMAWGTTRACRIPHSVHPTMVPDLSDDLTRLGLITLVQEAHPECRIDLCVDMARVIRSGGEAGNITDGWLPTAEALVKALEAAP